MTGPDIEALLADSITKEDPKRAFFFGAGLSVPAGLPLFSHLSAFLLDAILGDESRADEAVGLSEADIWDLAKAVRPEVLLQLPLHAFGERVMDFYRCLDGGQVHANHLYAAHLIRRGHAVFTTNVDCLIESACGLLGFRPTVRVSDDDFSLHLVDARQQGGLAGGLFKLHGSIEAQSGGDGAERFRSLRLSLRQVGRGLGEPKGRLLEACLRETDFIFLGYSACDHFSVQPYLTAGETDRYAYWFQHVTEDRIKDYEKLKGKLLPYVDLAPVSPSDSTELFRRPSGEEQSVVEVLMARPRGRAIRWYGDTNRLLAGALRSTGLGPIPEEARRFTRPARPDWVRELTFFERLMMAARIYQQAGQPRRAGALAERALGQAPGPKEQVAAHMLLAGLSAIGSTDEHYARASDHLHRALSLHEPGDAASRMNTLLDLVNLHRRRKEYSRALQVLAQIDGILGSSPHLPADSRQQAEAYYYRLLGLTLGLSGGGPHQDRERAIDALKRAEELASAAGDVAGRGAALNALGLVEMEFPERLEQARLHLEQSFDLYRHIGDARLSFQPLRNLGLALLRLARRAGDELSQRAFLRLAEAAYEQAIQQMDRLGGFAPRPGLEEVRYRLENEETKGEFAEVYLRLGEVWLLQLQALADQARQVLEPLGEFYRSREDWHNRARVLDMLHQADRDHGRATGVCAEIAAIYREVLAQSGCIDAMRQYPIRLKDARQILESAALRAEAVGDRGTAKEYRGLIESLEQSVNSHG